MAGPQNIMANVSERDVRTAFNSALGIAPEVWRNNCTIVNSKGPDEDHAWVSGLPVPSEFLGEYKFEGLIDHKYTVANKEYTLAFKIDSTSIEDQGEGAIDKRISQAAMYWATFKDFQLAALLEAAGTLLTYDGLALIHATRTIHESGTIDNLETFDAASPDALTAAEFLTVMQIAYAMAGYYKDDHGRAGYNAQAVKDTRAITSPKFLRGAVEGVSSTQIGSASNPWGFGIATVDELPYLTKAEDDVFVHYAGVPDSRALIYQERNAVGIHVLNGPADVAENHGVKVIITQRYRFALGEPRRIVRVRIT